MDTTSRTVKLIAFDLDDTLAPSKSVVEPEMRQALTALLRHYQVCIISGGNYGQFESQLLRYLTPSPLLDGLHVMPTCGTQYYRWADSAWQRRYAHELSPAQKAATLAALEEEARRLDLWSEQTWGPILEDRGSQITFSALGQRAPVDAKSRWDPDGIKRSALRDAVAPRVPELDVRAGGSTSIDVTLRGVDKAFGVRQLCAATGLGLEALLFIGDRLDETGNDYPVKALGVDCIAVERWQDTLEIVRRLVDAARGGDTELAS